LELAQTTNNAISPNGYSWGADRDMGKGKGYKELNEGRAATHLVVKQLIVGALKSGRKAGKHWNGLGKQKKASNLGESEQKREAAGNETKKQNKNAGKAGKQESRKARKTRTQAKQKNRTQERKNAGNKKGKQNSKKTGNA
jgi:hypothetical protein